MIPNSEIIDILKSVVNSMEANNKIIMNTNAVISSSNDIIKQLIAERDSLKETANNSIGDN